MTKHERARFLASAEVREPSPERVLSKMDQLEMAADAEKIFGHQRRGKRETSRLLRLLDNLDKEDGTP